MLSATTNTAALTAQRFLGQSSESASSSIAKMSSGSRIVKASDDASSLAIGNKLKADVAALEQAARNASQGASLIQVANGAVGQISDILVRLKTLSTQVVNGTLSFSERQFAQQEFSELVQQIDQISTQTRFNNVAMLNGGDKSIAPSTVDVANGSISGTIAGAATNAHFTGATPALSAFTGLVDGVVKNATVTEFASSNQFEIDIQIGDQHFIGTADVAAAAGSQIHMVSQSNPDNTFTLTVNGTDALPGTGNGGEVQDDLRQLLNVNTASAPASISSARRDQTAIETALGVTLANNAIVSTGATNNGTYMLTSSYDTVKDEVVFRLHHSETNQVFETSFEDPNDTTATDVYTVSFSNGTEVRFSGAVMANLDTADLVNGVKFDVAQGSATQMDFQIGEKSTDLVTINFVSMTSESLGLSGLSIETEDGGKIASGVISESISKLNKALAQLGAIQSRMEYVENNLAIITENLSATQGIFLDVDMAAEMTEFTKHQTLMDAGVAMLAQANQMPQRLLQLIQG